MCGIYGFTTDYSYNKKKSILKNISQTIRHRGPDQSGEFINNDIAIGIERLSIIDIERGNQPITSNNGKFIIIHNGEIYNYIKLRDELIKVGYEFSTDTDTEVIVNLYQQRGPGCLSELNGMFAFAIYNIENKELFIARDRFGIKPLYYIFNNKQLIFASELKGIVEYPGIDLNLSYEAIDLYMTMEYIPSPFTIYQNILKLEKGHYILLQNGELKKEKWYELSYRPKLNYSNEFDYIEELDGLIDESVRKRTISDVPLGAFLSGGLDSSLIAHYLNKYHNNLNTFSIGFEDASFDESQYSRAVSHHLCTSHHEEIFSSDRMLDMLPLIWDMMDEPFADASFLPTYLLSKFTRQKVTVSLSGDGGDEVFAGYPTYFAHKIARWIPSWSVSSLQYCSTLLPVNFDNMSFDFKVKQFCKGLSFQNSFRHQYWLGSFDEKQKQELYSSLFLEGLNNKEILSHLISEQILDNNTDNNWERYLYQDMQFYLQDDMLVKVDRSSMANSLEVRVPYLDHNVVQFMAQVPSRLKYKGSQSKYLLKKLGKKYLPDEVVDRHKKGFGIPIAKWFCGPLKEQIIDIIEDDKSYINTLFNKNYNIQLLNSHLNKKLDNRKLLWTLFVLENWLRTNKVKINNY